MLQPTRRHFARARLAPLLLCVPALCLLPVHAAPTGHPPLRVTFLALPRGEATLLEIPGGKTGLIGAGARGETPLVLRTLKQRGVKRIDVLMAATWSPEHVGGMPELLRTFPVRQLTQNPILVHNPAADALILAARAQESLHRVTSMPASMDSTTLFYTPPCQIRNVGPIGAMFREFPKDPECSLVVELTYDRFSFLSLGETRRRHQKSLWKAANPTPDGKLLRLSGRGEKDHLLPELLKPLGTRIAVIPTPTRAAYRPDSQLLRELRQSRVRVYRTDLQGTITVTTDGEEIQVKTER